MTIVTAATGIAYRHAHVLNEDGTIEHLFLTENELERLRERAAKKTEMALYTRPVPGWKRFVLRLLGLV
jgi:hypothetical protein